jgi:hypothetical protein
VGFESLEHDSSQRAYLFRIKDEKEGLLEFTLAANERSPLVQIPIVTRNRGTRPAKTEVVGQHPLASEEWSIGGISTLEKSDLVFWIPV